MRVDDLVLPLAFLVLVPLQLLDCCLHADGMLPEELNFALPLKLPILSLALALYLITQDADNPIEPLNFQDEHEYVHLVAVGRTGLGLGVLADEADGGAEGLPLLVQAPRRGGDRLGVPGGIEALVGLAQ